ncbi:probable glutamate receptor [Cherax quadricarinatus]|uniref:probable glutamate receptor n=1 Tax=Cherax quadricarinatus TaxID=27406 RepID=UPI00387EA783
MLRYKIAYTANNRSWKSPTDVPVRQVSSGWSEMVWLSEALLWSLLLSAAVYLNAAHQLQTYGSHGPETPQVIRAVLGEESDSRCAVFFFADGSPSTTYVLRETIYPWSPWGVAVFEVTSNIRNANETLVQLITVVAKARRLRRESWCTTVMVMSDDPVFLAVLVEWSLKNFLVWSTRLLVVTRLSLLHLHHLHEAFSVTNSMLLVVNDGSKMFSMYTYLPYSLPSDNAILLATWSPQRGLTLATNLPLFPDKFTRLLRRPTLRVATSTFHTKEVGKVHSDWRHQDHMLDYLAQGINFTYIYVIPTDGTFGSKQKDGAWTGMVGMVVRREADFALEPFGFSESRSEVVDFTWPVIIQYCRILSSRGRPMVDPWGFLLPLELPVWAATLGALMMLPAAMLLLSTCFSFKTNQHTWVKDIFDLTRIILQQDYRTWALAWWKRLIIGGWVIMALVLSKSYGGNLMSSLAVRHIQQPYQSIRDVLDDPSVTMLWQTNSANVQYFHSVESGIFREVADSEIKGRITYKLLSEFPQAINTLVRRGDHVLMDLEIVITVFIGQYFTNTGRCDFYSSRERFLPMVFCMIGQKNSPLVPALSKRMISLTEAGLYDLWFKYVVPNATSCVYSPNKITVSSSLSLTNLWGMFVILLIGHTVAVLVLCMEAVESWVFTP